MAATDHKYRITSSDPYYRLLENIGVYYQNKLTSSEMLNYFPGNVAVYNVAHFPLKPIGIPIRFIFTTSRLCSDKTRNSQRSMLNGAPGNVAVDNIALGLAKLGVNVVRVGNPSKVSLSLANSLTLSTVISLSHSLPLTLSHSLTLSLSHSHPLTLTPSHPHTLPPSHAHPHTLTLSLTRSLNQVGGGAGPERRRHLQVAARPLQRGRVLGDALLARPHRRAPGK